MKFEYPAGATPIDPDEAAGLIPAHVWGMFVLRSSTDPIPPPKLLLGTIIDSSQSTSFRMEMAVMHV
jgi:hypothetical protein